MSHRQELISNALKERSRDSGAAVRQLVPSEFGEVSGFVAEVRRLFETDQHAFVDGGLQPPDHWLDSEADCLTSLRQLALRQRLQTRRGDPPTFDNFVQHLRSTANETDERFQALTQRYSCPLNFSLPAEAESREHVLERLMVQDRARIEKNSIAVVASDDLLLRLNLVAVHAWVSRDLRFLDALNYYYELIPSNWRPHAEHDWLLVSYSAIYARALAASW